MNSVGVFGVPWNREEEEAMDRLEFPLPPANPPYPNMGRRPYVADPGENSEAEEDPLAERLESLSAFDAGMAGPDGLLMADPVPLEDVDRQCQREFRRRCYRDMPDMGVGFEDYDSTYDCFGCLWGREDVNAVSAPAMNQMLRIIDENVGMDRRQLAKIVHEHYRVHIRDRMRRMDKECPEWSELDVYIHLTHHIWEPRYIIMDLVQMLRTQLNVMKDLVFLKQVDGSVRPDPNALRMFHSTLNHYIKVLNIDPKKMNFYNPNQQIDLTAVGNFINMSGKQFTRSKIPDLPV